MTRDDLRVLSTALGFTAVVMKDSTAPNQAARASALAALIEAFCLETLPDSFPPDEEGENLLIGQQETGT